jgi:Ser/Thr protein kinase RdoA (MazF antagonist)
MINQTARLLDICRQLIDPHATVAAVHSGHDGTVVLRAATRHGHVIIKRHRGPDRHRQEVYAYQQWTPALGNRVPRLLAVSDNPPAVILTTVDGAPLSELHLDRASEREAHRQAGELLHRLHHAAPPQSEPDMTAWLAQRGNAWLHLAEDILPAGQRANIRDHLRELARLGPIPAVPCHLDFTPRNLICTPAGKIRVIDFEHARYDLAARDLVRMSRHVWTQRPDLERAFLRGYGDLTGIDKEVIQHCEYLDGLTHAVRGNGRPPAKTAFSQVIGSVDVIVGPDHVERP